MSDEHIDLEKRLDPLDPPYESAGEAKIGHLLDEHSMLFLYRQPMIIYERGKYSAWKPAFTLPDYNGLVVEYAHGPDRLQYMQEARHGQQVYQTNGVPTLYLYPADLTGPGWSERVAGRIQEAGEAAGRYNTLDAYAKRT